MTTEEWQALPDWVKSALTNAGYGPPWVREVTYEVESTTRRVHVAVGPKVPQHLTVTVAAAPDEGA